ncbi:MAG: hypothetical protein DSY46_03880, partial [Hydrogenimonas sp.]
MNGGFICSVCDEEVDEKYFDIEQKRCILHCEKKENDWYVISSNGEKDWNEKKVDKFWKYIQDELDSLYKLDLLGDLYDFNHSYEGVIFPAFQKEVEYNPYVDNIEDLGTNFYSYGVFETPQDYIEDINKIINKLSIKFISCTFLDFANFKKYHFKREIVFDKCKFKNGIALSTMNESKVKFTHCGFFNKKLNFNQSIFESSIEFDNCKDIDFSESEFHKEFIFKNCSVRGKANFYNTNFKGFADFTGTKFQNAHFEKAHFEDIVIFAEATFESDLDFKNTKFTDKAIFRDTTVEGQLNLREAVFKDEADFLDINSNKKNRQMISVANRETARIIKNFHDQANNIIEANR